MENNNEKENKINGKKMEEINEKVKQLLEDEGVNAEGQEDYCKTIGCVCGC